MNKELYEEINEAIGTGIFSPDDFTPNNTNSAFQLGLEYGNYQTEKDVEKVVTAIKVLEKMVHFVREFNISLSEEINE